MCASARSKLLNPRQLLEEVDWTYRSGGSRLVDAVFSRRWSGGGDGWSWPDAPPEHARALTGIVSAIEVRDDAVDFQGCLDRGGVCFGGVVML